MVKVFLFFLSLGMNCGFEDVLVLNDIWSSYCKGNTVPTPEQLGSILQEYTDFRNPDAEAMCDLAHHNYIEMRSSVVDPDYLLRKKVSSEFLV